MNDQPLNPHFATAAGDIRRRFGDQLFPQLRPLGDEGLVTLLSEVADLSEADTQALTSVVSFLDKLKIASSDNLEQDMHDLEKLLIDASDSLLRISPGSPLTIAILSAAHTRRGDLHHVSTNMPKREVETRRAFVTTARMRFSRCLRAALVGFRLGGLDAATVCTIAASIEVDPKP